MYLHSLSLCLQLLADEFEDKLGECRDKGVDNDAATRKATKASSAAARLGAKGKTPGQSLTYAPQRPYSHWLCLNTLEYS